MCASLDDVDDDVDVDVDVASSEPDPAGSLELDAPPQPTTKHNPPATSHPNP